MVEIRIKSLNQYIEEVTDGACAHNAYRGVRDRKYGLIPGIGRGKFNTEDEMEVFADFKRRARASLAGMPSTELEWLALAQHHGIATRLLDWSLNPLAALYFATKPRIIDGKLEHVKDWCAVYRLHFCEYNTPETIANPFSHAHVGVIMPPHVSPRIAVQAGIFTLHPFPQDEPDFTDNPCNVELSKKYIISATVARRIQKALFLLGVREEMLFPDVDGYARGVMIRNVMGETHYAHKHT